MISTDASLDYTLIVNIPHATSVVFVINSWLKARDLFSFAHDAMGQTRLLTILLVVANIPHSTIVIIRYLPEPLHRLNLGPYLVSRLTR
ncbi:hypothetical protein BDR07DRAFT_749547 [Suillus spraguei]|nr:hypothetical protein BDR07DRAFT_749547 [Suillus spraguei]